MGWIIGSNYLSGWARLLLFGRYGYVEMTRFLTIILLLFCRLSTIVRLCSVHSRLFSMRRTDAYLRRYVHGWRTRRRNLLPDIGDGIILELSLLHLIRMFDAIYVLYFLSLNWNGCVHPVMQRPGVMLNS